MMRGLALFLVVLLLVWQSGISDTARVSIIRPIAFVREYEYLRWQVQIDPREENRVLIISAVDGQDTIRSSREDLDGDKAPRTRWVEWKHGIPAGEYQVVAVLYSRTKNEVARASVPLTVLARF